MKIFKQLEIISDSNLLKKDYNIYSIGSHMKLGEFVSMDNIGNLVKADICDNVIGVVHRICSSNSFGDIVEIYNGPPHLYTPVI